jgi:hypothetical protein
VGRKAAVVPKRTREMDGVKLGSLKEDAGGVEGPKRLQDCGNGVWVQGDASKIHIHHHLM